MSMPNARVILSVLMLFSSLFLFPSGVDAESSSSLPSDATIFRSDMTRCLPAAAHAKTNKVDTWRAIPYAAKEVRGTLLYAPSFVNAPELTLPLDVSGWHHLRIGIWQPAFAYDGDTRLRVKLSGDSAFRRLHPPRTADNQKSTYIREVYLRADDLTDQALVIRKMNGIVGRNAAVAYVRLDPIPADEVARIKADRAQNDTRNLVATIDGVTYLHYGEYSEPTDVLDQIELYRHSDVAKVLWAVNYGDRTNYPTTVPGALFLGAHGRTRHTTEFGSNDYVRGEQQAHRAFRDFAAAGQVPQVIAAKHAHEMGLEFDVMFRLGILGDLGFVDLEGEGFFARYPHCRQVLADGTIVDKASYAFDETQDFTLALMRETLSMVDADGINLCFVRGPHALQYEAPVLERFLERHHEDARKVAADDPRLQAVRISFMNEYLEKVHRLTEEIAAQRGRPLNLSVWVWPGTQGVWLGGTPEAEGLDVKHWIKQGWLDSVIVQEGVDEEYIALGKETGCDYVLFTGYRGEKAMSPATVTAAYGAGVKQFAYWDMDAVQIMPDPWNWLRRIGHREEMADWETYKPDGRLLPLEQVGHVNVARGLVDAVYSGG